MADMFSQSVPNSAHGITPEYLPLSGESASRAMELLMRKGHLLEPKLTRADASQILEYMHLEHFPPGQVITFQAQSKQEGRLMMIIAGEANIRMRNATVGAQSQFSPIDQISRWSVATEGATLGLVHTFSGMSSRVVAQAATELFVASLSRESLHVMKKQFPVVALRFTEMLMLELALVTIEHERNLQALNSVARSMQSHIDDESDETKPAPLS